MAESVSVFYDDHESNFEKQRLIEHIQGRKRRREGPLSSDPSFPPFAQESISKSENPIPISIVPPVKQKIFLVTGVPSSQRPSVLKVIQKLGGKFIHSDSWHPDCTHLIVGRPSRTEKCLAACAAGTWYGRVSSKASIHDV